MNKFQECWAIITGRHSLTIALSDIQGYRMLCGQLQQQIEDLKRELRFARVGVDDLRAKFNQLGGEAKIKEISDQLAKGLLLDMKNNPEKYLGH